MKMSYHSFFTKENERLTDTHNRVEQNHENVNGVTEYVLNPSYYYSKSIIEASNITFITETMTERAYYDGKGSKNKKICFIYPVDNTRGHKYLNSVMVLYPLRYDDGTRCCVMCLKPIRKRIDESKEYADRLACVSCAIDLCRPISKPVLKKRCGFLG